MENLSFTKHTKVLVPAVEYHFDSDSRLLIPFTSGDKIGFMNNEGKVVLAPQYNMYYGECYCESDFIIVTISYNYGFPKSGGKVSVCQRPLFGLINYKGEVILEPVFFSLSRAIGNNKLYTAQDKNYNYGVLTTDGEEIIPFGKYDWIDGFDNGVARVKVGTISNGIKNSVNKWGLIDEAGNEILPIEYDNIWNFYGKKRNSTKIVKEGIVKDIKLSSLLRNDDVLDNIRCDFDLPYVSHYGEFEGSYAQDVMGYSDDVINDAFEGDPDNYWNID